MMISHSTEGTKEVDRDGPGVEVRRRWWREPVDPNFSPGETWADICQQEAGRNLTLLHDPGPRDDAAALEFWESTLEERGVAAEDQQLVEASVCWVAQAADMERVQQEIESGKVWIPPEVLAVAATAQASRPDLNIYIEPRAVEFTHPGLTGNQGITDAWSEDHRISLVADQPEGPQQVRAEFFYNPYVGNTLTDVDTRVGTVKEDSMWQRWNPDFDLAVETEHTLDLNFRPDLKNHVGQEFLKQAQQLPCQPGAESLNEIDQGIRRTQQEYQVAMAQNKDWFLDPGNTPGVK